MRAISPPGKNSSELMLTTATKPPPRPAPQLPENQPTALRTCVSGRENTEREKRGECCVVNIKAEVRREEEKTEDLRMKIGEPHETQLSRVIH
ncbi:hypothetical protein AgCh_005728 [Apium graveolens]